MDLLWVAGRQSTRLNNGETDAVFHGLQPEPNTQHKQKEIEMNKVYRTLLATFIGVLLSSAPGLSQGGPPTVTITSINPGSGTTLEPVTAKVNYNVSLSGATVYFYVDGSQVAHVSPPAGSNQWTTPPLYTGTHTLTITGPANSVNSSYTVNPGWDWTQNQTYSLYFDAPGFTVASGVALPWFDNQSWAYRSLGEYSPVSLIDFYRQEGWMLIYRDFGSSSAPAGGGGGMPWFVLYNKYRGTLRVFFWNSGLTTYSYAVVRLTIGGTAATPALSFYRNVPQFSNLFSSSQPDTSAVSSITNISPTQWSFADFNLVGYDSQISSKNCYLNFTVFGVNSTTLTANGGVTLDQIIGDGQTAADVQTSGSGVSSVLSTADKDLKNVSSAVQEVQKINNSTSSGWYKSALNSIATLASSTPLSLIPGISAIAGVVDGFVGLLTGNGGGNQSSAPIPLDFQGNLSINGTLTSQYAVSFPSIPVPASLAAGNQNGTGLYNNPLGIFSITTEPTVGFCYDIMSSQPGARDSYGQWYSFYGNLYLGLESPVAITYNPSDGLTLVSATAALVDPSQGMQTHYDDLSSFSTYAFQSPEYSDSYLMEQYVYGSDPIPSGVGDWASNPTLQIAIQLRFKYYNSLTGTTDTVSFLKTYPVNVAYDASIASRTFSSAAKHISSPLTDNSHSLPSSFEVQSYPNPFNPTATVIYQLPKASRVTITAYDVLGRQVATLADGVKNPGYYTSSFDGSDLASGIYFLRLIAQPLDGSQPTVKMQKAMLLK